MARERGVVRGDWKLGASGASVGWEHGRVCIMEMGIIVGGCGGSVARCCLSRSQFNGHLWLELDTILIHMVQLDVANAMERVSGAKGSGFGSNAKRWNFGSAD